MANASASSSSASSATTIQFSNGRTAEAVGADATQDPTAVLKTLGIAPPQALLLVFGGADTLDPKAEAPLRQLFSRGVARAAITTGALLMDGGTDSGVMRLLGQGIADRDRQSVLLGVAPRSKVTYPGGPEADADAAPLEPNHTHFVLTPGERWGSETPSLFALAEALRTRTLEKAPEDGKKRAPLPLVALIAGGGGVARDEALRAVRHGWPLLLITGSGGVADEIAQAHAQPGTFIEDAALAEIVADGTLYTFPLDGRPKTLASELTHLVEQLGGTSLLERAWHRFAVLDASAQVYQKRFDRMQLGILLLGVFAVLLALVQTEIYGTEAPATPSFEYEALRYLIIIIPILISVLLAASNRFKSGSKWILLRAAAEGVKRQIYSYRAQAGVYSDAALAEAKISRGSRLAEQLKTVTGQLMTTIANEAALPPYDGPIPPAMYGAAGHDDGYSRLTPNQYIDIRINDQLAYYESKTNYLERKLKVLQWAIYLIGGLGTLLAAIGLELWVALTTAVVTAIATYLEYRRTEYLLTRYNQTSTDLDNVHNWWLGLTASEKADPVKATLLVENTEKVLESDLAGWVQQMQDALEALAAQQAKQAEDLKERGINALVSEEDLSKGNSGEKPDDGPPPAPEPKPAPEPAPPPPAPEPKPAPEPAPDTGNKDDRADEGGKDLGVL